MTGSKSPQEFIVGNVYNVDFTTCGKYELFLKHLTFDGEYIASNYEDVVYIFRNSDNDLISIESKKINRVSLERRKQI